MATQSTTLGAVGGGDLAAAADVIAGTARQMALAHGLPKTAADISVRVAGNTAEISASTGAAYPAETRARHPLFGNREHWYGPPGEPFLAPAADARAGAAMARYARKLDRMLKAAGFE